MKIIFVFYERHVQEMKCAVYEHIGGIRKIKMLVLESCSCSLFTFAGSNNVIMQHDVHPIQSIM